MTLSPMESTPWAAGVVLLPLGSALLVFFFRRAERVVAALSALGVPALGAGIAAQVAQHGPLRYRIGGWSAPLGIGWRADGLSALLILLTGAVGSAATFYALGYFGAARAQRSGAREFFWPLWLLAWASLNALFLSADAFNLYVTLELLGLAAVALVAQQGTVEALTAATRYLLVNLLGSLLYLLGVALLYATYATLDLESLSQALRPGATTATAAVLVTAGLLLKTAAFPLHFWLPPAHGEAPAPVSALLSALVVKASFYLLLRFWVEVFAPITPPLANQTLGILGAGAILWGSLQALLQERLKLLVAYSTVAQVGYLLLVFPLARGGPWAARAWAGGVYMALSHGLAKAAMFLAAGALLLGGGHDRIADLGEILRGKPIWAFCFAAGAVSLAGLPPSGGFVGKWLLLQAAVASGQWWWAAALVAGGLLTAAYTLRVLGKAFTAAPNPPAFRPVPPSMKWTTLGLGLGAVGLGLAAPAVLDLLAAGSPVWPSLLGGNLP